MLIIAFLIQLLIIPALSPLGIGLIKKIKARLQNRQGASVIQPYRDLWKLFHKDEVISADASWIFRFAPFALFSVTLIVGASIPIFTFFPYLSMTSDMLVIIYSLSIGTFFMALAGMDTGSAFGSFGSSREMTLAALSEGGFLFSLLTLALISGTTNLFGISENLSAIYGHFFPSALLAFAGFFVVLLAETTRYPFDNPATHLELTMIHEAMVIEYSGKRLALMEWASANKLLIFASMGANLFFPFGIASDALSPAIFAGIAIFAVKTLVFYSAIAIVESSIAKFRFFRLPDLLVISFILNIIAIGLIRMNRL